MNDSKHVKALVTSRRDVSAGLWIVQVRPEEKISFMAGQYVTAGLPDAGKLVERPYSVASSPEQPELEFFLELVPGGHLTPQLYKVPVGEEIFLRRAAKGHFLFDRSSGRLNHFMVATVTGVAPYLSMVREMVAREAAGQPIPFRVVVLQAASVSQELGYFEELSKLARERTWLRYIPTVSRPWLDPLWPGERGRAEDVTRKHLDLLGFSLADTTAYVCGNPHMIENVKGVLQRAGFPKDSVKQEIYWLADKGG